MKDAIIHIANMLSQTSDAGKKLAVVLIVAVGLSEQNKIDELYRVAVRIAEREVEISEN